MSTPDSAPRTIEGRHLVLGILAVAFALALFGWWWHWSQVVPSLELWGADHALRLRDATESEAFRLESAESGENTLRIGDADWAIVDRRDASKTAGVSDVRRALLSDFAFVEPDPAATPHWQYALRLSDETGTSTFAFSPQTDQIFLVETGARATISPVARFVDAFFVRTLEGREPFDPPKPE